MRIFKSVMLAWWEVGVIKLTVWCFGLAVGATFAQAVAPFVPALLVIGAICAVWALALWLRK